MEMVRVQDSEDSCCDKGTILFESSLIALEKKNLEKALGLFEEAAEHGHQKAYEYAKLLRSCWNSRDLYRDIILCAEKRIMNWSKTRRC